MNTPHPHTSTGPGAVTARRLVPVTADWDRATSEGEARAVAEIERGRAMLPVLDPAVFDCYLGGLVEQMAADTEADPVGILVSLLCAAGVYLGPGPHLRLGDDRHPLLIWPLVIGRTGGGRKGASWSAGRRLFTAADAGFMTANVRSGLTSGEGLAQLFAEPDTAPRVLSSTPDRRSTEAGRATDDATDRPAGTEGESSTDRPGGTKERGGRQRGPAQHAAARLPEGDRRLLVFEPEWAAVMARMRREGNSLSATLRAAWEGGDLSTLSVTARVAPTSHIGLLAHITPDEFAARVSASDMAGGTYNRFLPVAVARSKFLPLAQGADQAVVDQVGAQLRERLHLARRAGRLTFTDAGAHVWRPLYVEFSSDTGDRGAVEQFVSRAAPNCLRIAALYAALDGATGIDAHHLVAAAALVRYSIASARSVFTDTADVARLLAFITDAGPIGRTRTEITNVVFGKNAKAATVTAALTGLLSAGRIAHTRRAPESGRGRPVDVFTAGGNGVTD